MKYVDCPFEAEVLAAVVEGRWPAPELETHAAACSACRETAAVAEALQANRAALRATLPDAGRVWWLAQLRARREAVEAAARPIAVVEILAAGVALGLAGALGGWVVLAVGAVVLVPAALLVARR